MIPKKKTVKHVVSEYLVQQIELDTQLLEVAFHDYQLMIPPEF
jgi:hypothetical protein